MECNTADGSSCLDVGQFRSQFIKRQIELGEAYIVLRLCGLICHLRPSAVHTVNALE